MKGEAQSNRQQRKARVNELVKKGELEGRIKMFSELNRLTLKEIKRENKKKRKTRKKVKE